jgi:hypothetical protein
MDMTFPLYDGGVTSGLLCGLLFGYVLESAGFASPRKLTAQFRLTDWSVFKVMFTAVIVAAIGLAVADVYGLVPASAIFIPTTYFWATLMGGALVGAGMAIGGYCPGTSVAGLSSGRIDAFVFMIGMVLGTGAFASVFDDITWLYQAMPGPEAQTLSDLFGVPSWAILAALVVIAALGFRLGSRLERRAGGALTAEQLSEMQPSRVAASMTSDSNRVANLRA